MISERQIDSAPDIRRSCHTGHARYSRPSFLFHDFGFHVKEDNGHPWKQFISVFQGKLERRLLFYNHKVKLRAAVSILEAFGNIPFVVLIIESPALQVFGVEIEWPRDDRA